MRALTAILTAVSTIAITGTALATPFVTSQPAQMVGRNGAVTTPLFTIGETYQGYTPVGILDGIGAYSLNSSTVRLLVNHELGPTSGAAYTLANGTSLTGARVSFFDIDKATRQIVAAGLAYDRVITRTGDVLTSAAQLGAAGFNRFCSSALFEASSYGTGRGLADRAYFMGEETSGGTQYVIDVATRTAYAAPAMGRGGWENVTQVDTGTAAKVAFIMGDDRSGAPMYLYVGEKSTAPGAGFLERNGLASGALYVWKSDDGRTLTSQYNSGTAAGSWVAVDNYRPDLAGQPGYDAQGYALQAQLDAMALAAGAFRFSRPEDVSTNPANARQIVLASTGSGFDNSSDLWGTTYTMTLAFDAAGNPVSGEAQVIYNGNTDPLRRLRSPDNLDWSADGSIMVQEDRSISSSQFRVSGEEASIVKLSLNGQEWELLQVAEINRLAVPAGQTDTAPNDFGNWESSGILDVSALFDLSAGSLYVFDVQAHSVRGGAIAQLNLVEGGQLLLLDASRVPEPASLALFAAGLGAAALVRRRRVAVAG